MLWSNNPKSDIHKSWACFIANKYYLLWSFNSLYIYIIYAINNLAVGHISVIKNDCIYEYH